MYIDFGREIVRADQICSVRRHHYWSDSAEATVYTFSVYGFTDNRLLSRVYDSAADRDDAIDKLFDHIDAAVFDMRPENV